MSAEEKMTIDERRKHLRRMRSRYAKAKRLERSQLLDVILRGLMGHQHKSSCKSIPAVYIVSGCTRNTSASWIWPPTPFPLTCGL